MLQLSKRSARLICSAPESRSRVALSLPVRSQFDEPIAHKFMGFQRTVMEGSEPLVQRDDCIRVVALKILVMQVVRITFGIDERPFANHDVIKARMSRGWRQRCVQLVEQCVDRMRRDDPMDKYA